MKKILLLQVRDDKETSDDELHSFASTSGLSASQFTQLNVFLTPDFDKQILDQHEALFIGGSSDASVLAPDKYPFLENCQSLIRYAYAQQVPVFASCFGFQLAVVEFGGEIILDQSNMEIGILPLTLTQEAAQDELFGDISGEFYSVMGHKERASKMPKEARVLAQTGVCPYQAFTFKDKPFYATQFHPEMSQDDLCVRLNRYCERYLSKTDSTEAILATAINDTTIANQLIKKFMTLFV